MDNMEEMDRFLNKLHFPRLNQEEVEIMNSPITNTEIEAVVKNLLENKNPGPAGFTAEFYQRQKKKQINKIRNEKGEVTTDNAKIQRIIRDHYVVDLFLLSSVLDECG